MKINYLKNIGIVILAAGKGKRLGCVDAPKVLCEINDKPIISYVLEILKQNGILKSNICLVVGFQKEKAKEIIGKEYIYADQEELLGTAHASHIGEQKLSSHIKDFLVLNGDDSAFYTFETLNAFVESHIKNKNDITLLTCEKDDVQGGKIIRDNRGKAIAIREKENLFKGEEAINEISAGTFCFNRNWFNKIYPLLKPITGLGELGLPSFAEEAVKEKAKFEAIKLKNPDEWFGINTKEQLKEADEQKRRQS
ncbi:sugar phosphate nucleotidyltransferase [Patescibacteria group bacterium]